jgi:hypothetical protein
VSSSCYIGNIFGVTTVNTATPVLIDSAGQLGTMSSSRRFKREIKEMDNASKVIHALKPVTFQYKTDNTGTPQFGLIAEEVAKVNPDLVVRDKDGKPYSVAEVKNVDEGLRRSHSDRGFRRALQRIGLPTRPASRGRQSSKAEKQRELP